MENLGARRGLLGRPLHVEPELSGQGKEHIVRIAPVQSFLRVGFWADSPTTLRPRFSVHEGRLPPASWRPGHVVVRQDRVLWSLQVVHLHLAEGDRLGGLPALTIPPADRIDRDWPSDKLPEIKEPDLQPNSCDCGTDIQWVDGGLFNVLV